MVLEIFWLGMLGMGDWEVLKDFSFSRMHSEGFPFIVGVWGWTCVRVALVVSSSSSGPRRPRVRSLISLLWAARTQCDKIISFKVWKVEEVSHEMLVLSLQTLKVGCHFAFCVAGAILWKRVKCKRVVFSWQAQDFATRRFAPAWQAQHFVTCPKCFFHESQCQGCANMTQWQKSWQAQHFVTALKSGGSLATNHTLGALLK